MGIGAPKPPTPIDPSTIINAQTAANRVDRITPFGSQTYGTGPNGQSTLTTSLSPDMQALMQHGMQAAQTPMQKMTMPSGANDLQNSIMSRMADRYSQPAQKPGSQWMGNPSGIGQNYAQLFQSINKSG